VATFHIVDQTGEEIGGADDLQVAATLAGAHYAALQGYSPSNDRRIEIVDEVGVVAYLGLKTEET
jgi:hypothetical protein